MKQYKLTYLQGNNNCVDAGLPASKSIANRALVIAALCGAEKKLNNLSDCDDTQAVIKALCSTDSIKNIGAAGTAMRFLTAYYAISSESVVMTGTERMKNRPISILVDALRSMGADIEYMEKEGFPPLRINGKQLFGGELHMQGNVSSQYLSAILMIAPYTRDGVKLVIEGDLVSRPYLQMTLSLMQDFGVSYTWDENVIEIKPSEYCAREFTVENDWSAASYWYSIVALSEDKSIKLKYLLSESLQGDSKLVELYKPLGVDTTFVDGGVVISKKVGIKLPSFYDISLKEQPDLAQTLVVSCLLLHVPFKFSGLENLKIKETDRIAALINECKTFGFVLKELESGVLSWDGEKCSVAEEIVIKTYEDHRMAMAFAPAVIKYGSMIIDEPDVVTKSYPSFWQEFQKVLPCDISIID
jgi:3-phosphoshikimate 1-carboxyvinyltransferase